MMTRTNELVLYTPVLRYTQVLWIIKNLFSLTFTIYMFCNV